MPRDTTIMRNILFCVFWLCTSTMVCCAHEAEHEHEADVFFLKNYQKSGDFLNLLPVERNILASLKNKNLLQYLIHDCDAYKFKHQCAIEDENFRNSMYPGTLWCGEKKPLAKSIHKGSEDDDLGYFKELDYCCKSHQNCSRQIQAHDEQYGIMNHENYTVYDCVCDDEFSTCLSQIKKEMNWMKIMKNLEFRSAQLYGLTYFNSLKTDCIEFPSNETFFPKFNFMGGVKADEKPILKLPRYFKPDAMDIRKLHKRKLTDKKVVSTE